MNELIKTQGVKSHFICSVTVTSHVEAICDQYHHQDISSTPSDISGMEAHMLVMVIPLVPQLSP